MSIKAELNAALKNISATAGMSKMPLQQAKIYEIWILFKLAESLKNDGWAVQIRGYDDKPNARFIERGAPGFIHLHTATAPKPSFVHLTRPSDTTEFELHNSVRFAGRSHALHEFDVLLISRNIGSSLRSAPKMRAAIGHPMMSIECKLYSGTAGIEVPRAILGSHFDSTYWRHPSLRDGSVEEGHSVSTPTTLATRLKHIFAAAIAQRNFSSGAQRLADQYHLKLYPRIQVGSPTLDKFLSDAKAWINAYSG